ncbi:PE-PGRS family domain protein [Mycobacterium kansasii]|uniref:PE-PGRS family domain protein n=1 Tax=Mycobacterium kansasii TaxID=1768 RepID=A0A1V3XXY2_MYCKA|nr:PE-PGRS family domain protein [Mycobacterium kansasii]
MDVGGLGSGIGAATRRQGADELFVKRRRVGAECLVVASMLGKQHSDGRRHLVGARG